MTDAAQRDSVIARATALLRAIGNAQAGGASTTDLARAAGMPRATAHRLLAALADQGFVDRSADPGRWSLGPELYLLGTAAAHRYDITTTAEDLLRELAGRTGESAFVSARRGDETVCLAEEEGSFPLRSHVLFPGKRFPLGVASAGLAILSHLPDEEIRRYLDRVDLTTEWGVEHDRTSIEARVAETRRRGFAINPGLMVHGSWGLGAAVFDRRGQPAWALSLTGVQTRFGPDRLPRVGEALLRAAHALSLRARGR